jgi:hypothetical protein
VAIALTGCAAPTTRPVTPQSALVEVEAQKQQEIALRSQLDGQTRLLRLAYPILKASADLCKDRVRTSIGVVSATRYSFDRGVRDTAIRVLGVGEVPKVVYVIPGSPGDAAGVRTGDVLVAVGGQPVPTGEEAVQRLNEEVIGQLKPAEAVTVSVMREGVRQDLSVTPTTTCDVPPVLQVSDEVNAFTDGDKIVVTRGLMRFAENDQELALVISHELAHAAMGHVTAQMQNYVLGSLLDILAAAYGINTGGSFGKAAAGVYSKGFEAEADYVGLYMMARAGLPVDNAAAFWRRMAAEHPQSIDRSATSSHPSTPERFIAIEGTVEEIARKRGSGLPLAPELRAARSEAGEQTSGGGAP